MCATVLGQRREKAEAEGDQSPARRRRRIESHGGVPVPPIERLAPLDAIARKIVMGEIAAMIARLRDDGLAHVAVDEEPRAIFGEPFERLGKLLVAERRRPPIIGLPSGAKMRATPWLAVRIGAMTVNR